MTAKAVERTSSDELREQLAKVGDDLGALGSTAKDIAHEKLDHARTAATEYYKQGKAKAQAWEKSFESTVKEHPVKSVLIAAGVGLVLGLLLRRR